VQVNEGLAAAQGCKKFREFSRLSDFYSTEKLPSIIPRRPPSPIWQNSIRAKRSALMIFAS